MDILYTIGSFVSFLGVIFLLIGFKKDFIRLNSVQKIGIILTSIGVAIPFLIGFVDGFLAGV
jgi:Kef-type K+ transport system membrane component KefB